ncbi:MAG: GTP pyrophosphokinase [Peptococcaceae bacterium]|nr:GTP pyrophosphokinase [Peptococcaceae bacterium]
MHYLEIQAFMVARDAHKDQVDKAGKSYLNHPTFVAGMMDTDEEKAVAWLHDVVEDTEWTLERLTANGFPPQVVEAVGVLTHDANVSYGDYIARIKENPLARKVKIADLKHNLDLTRLPEVTEKDIERCRKYLDALQQLIS